MLEAYTGSENKICFAIEVTINDFNMIKRLRLFALEIVSL